MSSYFDSANLTTPDTYNFIPNDNQAIDPERIPLKKAPAWYEIENSMKTTGIALTTIGTIGTVACAGAICAVAAVPVGIGLCATGIFASIGAIATGVFLNKKDYWEDPNFVDKIAAKVQSLSFDNIILTYGWEKTCEYHFISKTLLAQKFFDSMQSRKMSYKSIVGEYGSQITKFKFIEWQSLKPFLACEIMAAGMDIATVKRTYGEQPLLDGVFKADDSLLRGKIVEGIKNKSYAAIKQEFSFELNQKALTTSDIANELRRQYTQATSFAVFMQNQGGNQSVWNIISDKILPAAHFTLDIMNQTQSMSVSDFIKTFGWNVFETGTVSGTDFQHRFLNEESKTPFSQIIARHGWSIFRYNLAEPRHFKANALGEIKNNNMSFEQIVNVFTWKAFTWGVLDGSDKSVRNAFIDVAGRKAFCDLWDIYSTKITDLHLLSDATLAVVQELYQRKKKAETAHSNDIYKIKSEYDATVSKAASQKSSVINEAERRVDAIKNQISKAKSEESSQMSSFDFNLRRLSNENAALEREMMAPKPIVNTVRTPQPAPEQETVSQGRTVPGTRTAQPAADTCPQNMVCIPLSEIEKGEKLNKINANMAKAAYIQRQRLGIAEQYFHMIQSLKAQLAGEEQRFNQIKILATNNYDIIVSQATKYRDRDTATCNATLEQVKTAINTEFAIYYSINVKNSRI
jgi:hypothetical protein